MRPTASLYEAEHLHGSSDIVGVISAVLKEEARRRKQNRLDSEIPMRLDHGHLLASDIGQEGESGLLAGRQS